MGEVAGDLAKCSSVLASKETVLKAAASPSTGCQQVGHRRPRTLHSAALAPKEGLAPLWAAAQGPAKLPPPQRRSRKAQAPPWAVWLEVPDHQPVPSLPPPSIGQSDGSQLKNPFMLPAALGIKSNLLGKPARPSLAPSPESPPSCKAPAFPASLHQPDHCSRPPSTPVHTTCYWKVQLQRDPSQQIAGASGPRFP